MIARLNFRSSRDSPRLYRDRWKGCPSVRGSQKGFNVPFHPVKRCRASVPSGEWVKSSDSVFVNRQRRTVAKDKNEPGERRGIRGRGEPGSGNAVSLERSYCRSLERTAHLKLALLVKVSGVARISLKVKFTCSHDGTWKAQRSLPRVGPPDLFFDLSSNFARYRATNYHRVAGEKRLKIIRRI